MKAIYYIIQWTWGIIMTFIGFVVFCISKIFKKETYKYRNNICIVSKKLAGGVDLGMFFMRGENDENICPHEDGHGIQNLWWGPLFPFVIAIPSMIRYWLRLSKDKVKFTKTLFAIIIIINCLILPLFLISPIITYIQIVFLIYSAILEYWLFKIEIPKYDNGARVPYDEIWFEGQATQLGETAETGKWKWL